MAGKEFTIFKSSLFWTLKEEEEQKKFIKEQLIEDAENFGEEVDLSDENIDRRFWEDLDMFYDDARLNLNKKLPNNIIAIGTVGVWNGTFNGGKLLGDNLNEVLFWGECDDINVYYDRYNVCSDLAHHDGQHHMTYRMLKDGVDGEDLLYKHVYEGGLSSKDITRYTKSLKPFVKEIYG